MSSHANPAPARFTPKIAAYGILTLLALVPITIFVVAGADSQRFALDGAGGPLVAFSAGVLSFASPCVLPIVPIYVANLAGASVQEGRVVADPRKTFTHSIAFLVGLTAVFVALGASAGLIGFSLTAHLAALETVAGTLMIVMGTLLIPSYRRRSTLHSAVALVSAAVLFVGVVEFAGLAGETRRVALLGGGALIAWAKYSGFVRFSLLQRSLGSTSIGSQRPVGYVRSGLIGGAFAAGWTPCIGPVLAGILTLAATSASAWTGTYLLLVYSAGFAIPFLAVGLLVGDAAGTLKTVRRYLPVFEVITAAMLLAIGALLLSGQLTALNAYFDFGVASEGL